MIPIKKAFSLLLVLCLTVVMSSPLSAQQKQTTATKLININSATIQELSTLPRIGEQTAKRIVEFRKTHGKFKRIQDLMKVKGIGEKTFKKFEKLITV